MNKMQETALKLGASLYVPCTRRDLREVAAGKIERLRSVIFCLEDAVRDDELLYAMDNLADALETMRENPSLLRFVRVRNPDIAAKVLEIKGSEMLDGFVLPKVDSSCFSQYAEIYSGNSQYLMPTLETAEVFDFGAMIRLRDRCLEAGWEKKALPWRIGGNDLMNLLGVRRSRVRTIYDGPLSNTLSGLASIFKPHGFNLTAPVFELLDHRELLNQEVPRDLEFGFFGKTAIHPDQVPLIEQHYKVFKDDLCAAEKILSASAPAVFKFNGAMCEPKTHDNWAEAVLARAAIYGVIGN